MDILYVKIFFDDMEALDSISDAARGRLLSALVAYADGGRTCELKPAERALFLLMKKRIDREREAMLTVSEKRSECGKKGGRPRVTGGAKTEAAYDGHTEAPVEGENEQPEKQKAKGFSGKQKKLNKEKEKDNRIKQETKTIDTDTDTDYKHAGAADGCLCEYVCDDRQDSDIYESVYGMFNSACPDLPKVISGFPERERLIDRRVAEAGGDLSVFGEVFGIVDRSDFLCGRTADGSGWRATFDWILSDNNWTKIIEGCYSASPGSARSGASSRDTFPPTYDIGEIERQLDLEWELQFAQ